MTIIILEYITEKMIQKLINTHVDGTNVKEVNLWAHKTNRDKIVARCKDEDLVTEIETDGTYSKVRTEDGKVGWCMSGFLK